MIPAQNRHREQWSVKEIPEIIPYGYNQMTLKDGAKSLPQEKDMLFNKCYWENWISTCRRLNRDPPHLSSCTKMY
jgi:hypothetical protein